MSILRYKVDGSGRLHERIVIVTGASSGMGRGTALALAREVGHVVSRVSSDIREECAQHGFEEDKHVPNHTVIANNGGIAAYQKCDISNTAEIFALIEFAIKIFSRIDIFINNAAVWWAFRDLIEETDKQWDIMMAVNGKGCATAMREAIK